MAGFFYALPTGVFLKPQPVLYRALLFMAAHLQVLGESSTRTHHSETNQARHAGKILPHQHLPTV